MTSGSLTVVGTGIQMGQVTLQAQAYIQSAEKLLFLVADALTYDWLCRANPTAESLHGFYTDTDYRLPMYNNMVERILECVREGNSVCVAFYGHPGVFVYPSHEAIKRARHEGYKAKMLPGVSAEDCLFADIGIDPGTAGCQSFEATSFALYRPSISSFVPLILWQIDSIGDLGYSFDPSPNKQNLQIIVDLLASYYGMSHEVIIYEAAQFPVSDPGIQRTPLEQLPDTPMTGISTLYVPPMPQPDPDKDMVDRLGISDSLAELRSAAIQSSFVTGSGDKPQKDN